MENEKEITKLVNVLRQIRRTGRFAKWFGEDNEEKEFCLQQYNKIVERLAELEPSIKDLFTTLPQNTSPKTLHFAVSELIAYLTDGKEAEEPIGFGCRPRHETRRGRCGKKRFIFAFNHWGERF